MKLFVSGSKSISVLPDEVKAILDEHIALGTEFLVGDCYGVDAAVQKYLESKGYSNVTIYCSGETPRNNFVTGRKSSFLRRSRQGPYRQRIPVCERHPNGTGLRPGLHDLGWKKQRHR